jgi:ParB family chromosome partitioning protein
MITPSLVDAVVDKVAAKRITNSKDLRKLRQILPDPVAREHFLSRQGGDIDKASSHMTSPHDRIA